MISTISVLSAQSRRFNSNHCNLSITFTYGIRELTGDIFAIVLGANPSQFFAHFRARLALCFSGAGQAFPCGRSSSANLVRPFVVMWQ